MTLPAMCLHTKGWSEWDGDSWRWLGKCPDCPRTTWNSFAPVKYMTPWVWSEHPEK